jgi:hypothetical protein
MAEELNVDELWRIPCLKISEWGMFQQRWCNEFCLKTRKSGSQFVEANNVLCKVKAMNHNASNTIQKQNTKACDRKHNCHWQQKTKTCHKPKWRQCQFVFLWSQGLCLLWISWTPSKSELVLWFWYNGKVTWRCSLEDLRFALMLDLESRQCPCSWWTNRTGVFGRSH